MIQYSKELNIKKVIKEEKKLVSEYKSFEKNIKSSLKNYIDEFNDVSFENEVLKTMLLNNFQNGVIQADNNILNIQSLSNILDILENQEEVTETDIETYNKLATKVDKDIELLQKFLHQTLSSFENVPLKGKKKDINALNQCKKEILEATIFQESDNSQTTSTAKKVKSSASKTTSKSIKKKFDVSTSDLLCFFPKNPSDNLVISTSQENYKISFKNNIANIYIEDEDFNLSLKTLGVQISNSITNNILFVSQTDEKYTLITNSQIEIPPFVQVTKISKNDDFLEVEISNDFVDLYIEDGVINFENDLSEVSSPVEKKSNVKSKNEEKSKEDDVYESQVDSIITSKEQELEKDKVEEEPDEITDNNTLIISDSNKNVILPYKLEDLEKKLKENKKYKTLEDVIKNEYTIPLETFKNPTKSRFREAFQLIKKKEKGSLKEAIELGFELMFQSDLNPAVIAACKDLDELDIYLDCLDDNELEKFSCFKIQYDIPPTKKSKR